MVKNSRRRDQVAQALQSVWAIKYYLNTVWTIVDKALRNGGAVFPNHAFHSGENNGFEVFIHLHFLVIWKFQRLVWVAKAADKELVFLLSGHVCCWGEECFFIWDLV
jgi:hypothetical protein